MGTVLSKFSLAYCIKFMASPCKLVVSANFDNVVFFPAIIILPLKSVVNMFNSLLIMLLLNNGNMVICFYIMCLDYGSL